MSIGIRNAAERRPQNEGLSQPEIVLATLAEWIVESEEASEILSTVLEDLLALRTPDAGREEYRRYRLYLRSFFSECARAKDGFFRLTRKLEKLGVPIDSQRLRADYARNLHHLIVGRNRALHDDLGRLQEESRIEWGLMGLDRFVHPGEPASDPGELLGEAIGKLEEPLQREIERLVKAASSALEEIWRAAEPSITGKE